MGDRIRCIERGSALPAWVYKRWPQQPEPSPGERAALARLESDLAGLAAAGRGQVRLSLYDCATGWEAGIEAHRSFYPASMIKTLLLLAALEQLEQGSLSLGALHELRESDRYAGGVPVAGTGVLQFAAAGSSYTFEELLTLMMALSDNVATNIIFEQVGGAGCSAMTKKLGLKSSAFTRKFYDTASKLPSNAATVHELNRMLLALQKREAAEEKLTRLAIRAMAAAEKGRIGRFIGKRALIANKVGTVESLVGDMALLYFPHRPPLALTVAVERPCRQEEAARLIGVLAEKIVRALAGYPST